MNAKPKIVRIQGAQKSVTHHAQWILVDPDTIVKNGYLTCENFQVKKVSHHPPEKGRVIEHGKGLIMPLMVNAHVHLELSALHGKLPFDKGFEAWVAALLEKREQFSAAQLLDHAQSALGRLIEDGTGYVGEISTLNLTRDLLVQNGAGGIFFHEVIGEALPEISIKKDAHLSMSLAGHAPHSCSPDLLCKVKAETRKAGVPFSIHLAESQAESEFIKDQKGSWANFLTLRGIHWETWNIRQTTPVAHVADLGILDENTLTVHLINADAKDLAILKDSNARVCVCPRSNMNLHGKTSRIDEMIQAGLEPALGTDSLASCDSLNLFDEMNFVKNQFPGIADRDIVAMATVWGAKALNLDHIAGTLEPGKNADCICLELDAESEENVLKKVIGHD